MTVLVPTDIETRGESLLRIADGWDGPGSKAPDRWTVLLVVLLLHMQGEYPHVVCRQEITSDPYRERLEAEVTRLRDELQAIAERVGPAIGEGQIATQERRPGEVARAVRTLVERSRVERTEARHGPGQRVTFDGEEFMLPTMLAAEYLAADDGDFEGRLLIVLRGAAELHKMGGAE